MAYPQHICPKCRSDEIARVPRNRVVERMAGLLGWRVYICRECRYRFYDRPSQRKAS
jgi:predicted nucleic-acid-binding Zn-ribbon protein